MKKRKLRNSFFHVLSKYLKENKKNSKQRKAWAKGFCRERKNKSTYHKSLQRMRVSDIEGLFKYMLLKQ